LNSEIIHYGLAYQNNVVLGHGLQARVETMKGCSFGDTKDVRKEWALQNQHYLACAGKKECNLNLTMSQIFDAPCLKEIN
jgi:hypothetical protein